MGERGEGVIDFAHLRMSPHFGSCVYRMKLSSAQLNSHGLTFNIRPFTHIIVGFRQNA